MAIRLRPVQLLVVAAALLASCQPASHLVSEPTSADVALTPDFTILDAVVPPNATLESLLRQRVPGTLAKSIVSAVGGVFNPRKLKADRPYRIVLGLDGLFREFRYDIDADNLLRVVFRDAPDTSAGSFDVAVVPVPKAYELAAAAARITPEHNSLIDAFDAEGETLQLPLRVADIFGGEVDFNSELQLGDAVHVLFDRATRDGQFVGYGDVKAAVLSVGRRQLTVIRYAGPDGSIGYFDEAGRSMRRQFLKSPLPFSPRVTSGFSTNRFHPVRGGARPHLGVDFGAPFGTPVNAVGAGVVEAAEWAGDAGRMVRIRHAGGYETAYLHLSSFAPGIRPGARVEQGELIGRVGQTGAATGPHLDYRIIKNGVYVNPLTAFSKMPQGDPVPADQLADFTHQRDEWLRDLRDELAGAESRSSRSR